MSNLTFLELVELALVGGGNARDDVIHADHAQVVAAQVSFESKLEKRFIMFQPQALISRRFQRVS